MRLSFVPLCIAASALSACGASSDPAQEGSAATETVSGETAAASADGFPAGFSLYSGATIVSQDEANIQGRPGSTWILQTDDTAQQIIKHYADQSAAAGFDVGDINAEDTASFFSAKRASDRGEILASANRAPGADVTTLNLTIVAATDE